MQICDYFELLSKENPKKKILEIDNKEYSYNDLNNYLLIYYYFLKKNKISNNQKVAIFLENCLEFYLSFLIGSFLKLTIVPLNNKLNSDQIFKQIKTLNIKQIITSKKYKKIFSQIKKSKLSNLVFIEDFKNFKPNVILAKKEKIKKNINFPYILSLTSGSTSDPKVMIFSEYTKILRAKHAIEMYKLLKKDIFLLSTPFYHSISQRLIFTALILGSKLVVMKRFSILDWIKIVYKKRITFTISVSDQIAQLSEVLKRNDYRLLNLKKWVSCCSALNIEKKKKILIKFTNNFYDTYGASEVGTISNFKVKKDNKINSVGKIVNGNIIKIIKKNNNNYGEILCKSEQAFVGYYKKKKRTNFFFQTGDLGYLDSQNYLYITGRSKDVIISGGMNIVGKDIEDILKQYKNVNDLAVFPIRDKMMGEKIAILIEPRKSFDLFKFKKFCISKLPHFQLPQEFYIGKITYTALGKINKPEILKLYDKQNRSRIIKNTQEIQ
jgi:acyl-CoA synthetase (AMP-forming)/AMP-acid ligase II